MKFNIPVIRVSYAHKTIEIEAENLNEAIELALDTAGNYEFSESSSEYLHDE
jgi:hypothetical protein